MTDNAPEPEPSPLLKAARERYKEFTNENLSSNLISLAQEAPEFVVVKDPWGDRSIALIVPESDAALLEALTNVYLPPRFSAIYYRDTRDLEVIWTAYKLDEDESDLEGRVFELELPSSAHVCEFKDSSARLLEIARAVVPLGVSRTGFRNLQSFHRYLVERNEDYDSPDIDAYGKPLSFWIGNVDWDEDAILDLVRHINFYLRYYDFRSPVIEVHPVGSEAYAHKNRYLEGFKFPTKLVSQKLDTKLLVIYSAAFSSSNVATNFLNLYRVVEYVSYNLMHQDTRKAMQSIIARPHALHDLDRTSTELLLLAREVKFEREQDAILRIIKEVVSPSRLWAELVANKGFFAKPCVFEGGLELDALMSDKLEEGGFGTAHVEAFARACTKIRNALAHGRDSKTADSILPTARNFEQLRPWSNGLALAAGEVVLWDAAH